MWQYRPTEELYHYGVPGMRWGVRKEYDDAVADYHRQKSVEAEAEKRYNTANDRYNSLRSAAKAQRGNIRSLKKQKRYDEANAAKAAAKSAKKDLKAAKKERNRATWDLNVQRERTQERLDNLERLDRAVFEGYVGLGKEIASIFKD